jgi:DNA polymerase V
MLAEPLGPHVPSPPVRLPLLLTRIPAGFPSPADDYVDQLLDLNDFVSADAGTYYFRAEGESMTGVGIFPGDVLVVKRGAEPRSGDVVIAALDGEFTVKRYVRRGRQAWLVPENEAYPSIEILPGHELVIYGVVSHALHTFRRV